MARDYSRDYVLKDKKHLNRTIKQISQLIDKFDMIKRYNKNYKEFGLDVMVDMTNAVNYLYKIYDFLIMKYEWEYGEYEEEL